MNHNHFVGTASKYVFDNYMVNVKFAVGGTFVILFCEFVYFAFCFYVLSSVVSYFAVLLWFCAVLLA